MRIGQHAIARPVMTMVINLVIVLLGLVSYERLSVREYPNIDVPVVTVTTNYIGASARIIETQITKPLEDALSGIEGIDYVKSISRSEQSQITIQFRLSRDADAAASDVRDRVARARQLLPQESDEPVVAKVEADAQPMMWLSVNSEQLSPLEVSEIADTLVQDRLQTLPGVAQVIIFAQRLITMRVDIDREKLAGFGLTVNDVETALRAQNVEIPAGRIESLQREFTVLAETDVNSPEEFAAIILRESDNGYLVRLADVARVYVGALEERQLSRFNNKNSVALGIVKQSTANPLEISREVRAALPTIEAQLPPGIRLETSFDSSVFIEQSIRNVFTTIAEAMLLVSATIFFFLRSVKATSIPLLTIPVSLIGAFFLMLVLGFTINTLTLLALVIAIGLVVDDAIVVLENSYRHIEEGMTPMQAAKRAMDEIGFAVVAMTLTLITVFLPLSFTEGRTGKLFIEFALTLAGAVLVSGIVALTLSPMMCAYVLKPHTTDSRWSQRVEAWLKRLEEAYLLWLKRYMQQPWRLVSIAALVAVISAGLFMALKSELSPREDRGVIFAIAIAPEGSTIGYMDGYARQMEKLLQSVAEAKWNFIAVGFPFVTQSFSVLGLKPWHERSRTAAAIIAELQPKLAGIAGTLNFAINPASLGQQSRSQPVEFVIQTSGSYADLDRLSGQLLEKMRKQPGFIAPDSDLKLNKPELRVQVNREKAASLGVSVESIGRALETMLGGRKVTRFKRGSEQYDVLVKLADNQRRSPSVLQGIYVRSAKGQMVPLSNLVSLEEGVAPRELNHFNKLRAVTITASLSPDFALGEALEFLQREVTALAPDARQEVSGQSREFKESNAQLGFIFALALAFIYLVLAAQFESFRDPLIILLAVPMAMAGALLAMHVAGVSLNVYSQIGLVALIGLIAKHGIMMVEFANQLQHQGHDRLAAIARASATRLRPILMTTAATVLGAAPLALASGAGAESRQAIGWVVVGGMSLGTVCTLYLLPAFYVLLARSKA